MKKYVDWLWPKTLHTWCQRWFGIASTLLLVYSIKLGMQEFGVGFCKDDPIKVRQAFFLGLWIILPPIWFWFEYYFLYKGGAAGLEELKHGQDQSSKIWLALVTLLLGMYFGKDLIRDSSATSCHRP